MGQAAYNKKVRVSADDGTTWHEVPCPSPSLDMGGDILDDTELATNQGYRTRIYGLRDWSVSCDAMHDDENVAVETLKQAWLTKQKLLVQYLPSGVTKLSVGLQGQVVVESFNLSGEVAGLETAAISLQADGPISQAS